MSLLAAQWLEPGGGGGESYVKWLGMLIISLRDVNYGLLASLRMLRIKHHFF